MTRYRISALGRQFGLSRSTLLYYDRIGLLHATGRSESAYRHYNEADVARLERICFFRDAGLSLTEIAGLLDANSDESTIMENRLREINREMAALRSQQRLITGALRTVAVGQSASGLNRELWASLQKACGLDHAALERWHAEFERRAPQAHHDFLLGLGLSEKEAQQVRLLTKNIEENTMSMQYFFDVFEDLPRQGPGCREATLQALGLLADLPRQPRVLDIGCGCGVQTQILAEELKTPIIAVDNHRPVLDRLEDTARRKGLPIEVRELSMVDMPFDAASFDLLWAEGSIFVIGLERGLHDFNRYLKPGGYLAFTEMCWFSERMADRPAEAIAYFDHVYPDIRSVAGVRELAAKAGYRLVGDFNLPAQAWWDDYYTPMLARIETLRSRDKGIAEAEAVYTHLAQEAEMHRKYAASYGYAFFVLQKP